MKDENELDHLFKKGLEDPEIPFNDLDWIKMADRLDAGAPKKVRLVWLYAAAGIAATLLVLLFWFLSDNSLPTQNKPDVNVITKSKPAVKAPEPNSKAIEAPLGKPESQNLEAGPSASITGEESYSETNPSTNQSSTPLKATQGVETPLLADVKMPQLLATGLKSAQSHTINLTGPIGNNPIENPDKTPKKDHEDDIKEVIKNIENMRPGKLVLTILAAPDITNTNTSIGNKVSSNFGLLLTYPLTKKLSVSSGAIYAKKLYNYGGTGPSVYGKAGAPYEIDGTCFVLDIPLNLNFQVFKKKNIAISVNSGLSSYLMLKEKYKYSYTDPDGTLDESAIEISNKNQHILGVANFSVNLEHKVNRNLSIGIQPFYKVPLTGIGLYDVNLKSKGVALSISVSPFRRKTNP